MILASLNLQLAKCSVMNRIVVRIFIFLFFTICIIFFYLYFLLNQKEIYQKRTISENQKIIAYSLLKEIEIDSQEYDCETKIQSEDNFQENQQNQKWIRISKTNIFIYSIYQDTRLYPYKYLRIIAMIKGDWRGSLYCQIQSTTGDYYITKTRVVKIWSKSWNLNDPHIYYNPFLLSCHLPTQTKPTNFSISKIPCIKTKQTFRIPPTKSIQKFQNFTICVKPLNFHKDISERLIPWIIINKILGASKFEFYLENLPRRITQILTKLTDYNIHLNHFTKLDELIPDEAIKIWQKRRYEVLIYNDCFYRNLQSQFIIPLDIDEIIIPRQVFTWLELFNDFLKQDNYTSYTVRNTYYLRQFNRQFRNKEFFFRDIIRSDFSQEYESGKSFISTRNTLTVFNHYGLKRLKPGVGNVKFLDKQLVQMNHYKDNCDTVILPECAKYLSSPTRIIDDVIFKYKQVFYQEYKKLRFINKTN